MLIVHWKTFTPTPKPVTPVVLLVAEVITPVPDTNVQLPVPIAGRFPLKVAVVAHTVWFTPAIAGVGLASCCTETVDDELGHTPLPIVHWNTFAPTPNPVTALLFTRGEVTDDGPLSTLHVPVPIAGIFPFRFVDVAHTV